MERIFADAAPAAGWNRAYRKVAMTSVDREQAIGSLVASGSIPVPPYPAVAFQIEKLVRGGDFGLDLLGRASCP